jgi:hypothetical protein
MATPVTRRQIIVDNFTKKRKDTPCSSELKVSINRDTRLSGDLARMFGGSWKQHEIGEERTRITYTASGMKDTRMGSGSFLMSSKLPLSFGPDG